MQRSTRARIGIAAVFGLGLAAGIVAFMLISRAGGRGGDGAGASGQRSPASPVDDKPPGRPMPEGCAVDPSDPPVLAYADLPGNRLNLGARKQGEKFERTVIVRNVGNGVLCVRDIETGCGCVKARWIGDPHVPPSASGTLSLDIDTSDREGDQEKWVTLHTNDPKQRFGAVLTVALDVRLGLVVMAPPGGPAASLEFGTHPPGEPGTVVLRMKCPKDEPEWAVLGVESDVLPERRRATFTWSIERVEPDHLRSRVYDLRITHPGRLEHGRDAQSLVIRTSHPDRPEIRMAAGLTVASK